MYLFHDMRVHNDSDEDGNKKKKNTHTHTHTDNFQIAFNVKIWAVKFK